MAKVQTFITQEEPILVYKKTLVKVILIQLLYLCKSGKVQTLKCTRSIKVKNSPLRFL